jgi:8-oxo-dGTP pyrophosphatase MutT (NUDIX family)
MIKKISKARHEVSAGGLVFKRLGGQILFAMIKDSYGKWTFPKGHVEPGETIVEAAAREILEELALEEICLLERLGKIDIWFKDPNFRGKSLIHKDIYFYLFSAPANATIRPVATEHVLEAAWVPAKELLKKFGYENLTPIINRAFVYVR